MNRELSQGVLVTSHPPYSELGWETFHHDFLQIIFVFEFALNK